MGHFRALGQWWLSQGQTEAPWGLTSAIGLHSHLVQEHHLFEQADLIVSIRLQVPLRVGLLDVVDILWQEIRGRLLICRDERSVGMNGRCGTWRGCMIR